MRAHRLPSFRGVCAAAFVILWCAAPAAHAVDAAPIVDAFGGQDAAGTSEMVLELRLNGGADGEACIVLIDGGDGLWLERRDFARLRLRPPPLTPRVVGDREYLPLAAVAGVRVSIDVAASTADLEVPAGAFIATTQSLPPRPARAVTGNARGAFLNYELYAQHGDYAGGNSAGGFGELGVFSGAGC
ncbi:MAG: hypothetical protein U1F06_00075 [Steroidobacteraceae bacterium]